MRRAFVCPLCKDRNVTFSGVKGNLIMRATSEWVAGFVCGNFHTFFVLLADAAPQFGIEKSQTAKLSDIQKNVRKVKLPGTQLDEPRGWRELQNLAQQERDPHRLARLVDQMNDLLAECEKKEANADASSSLEPDPSAQTN